MAELKVEARCDGWRLDRFVRDALPGMPLSHIFKLFRTGKVRLDGKKAPPSERATTPVSKPALHALCARPRISSARRIGYVVFRKSWGTNSER